MTELDKVIKGLECCAKYPNEFGDCLGGDCPYGPRIECHKELMGDAMALLKAQHGFNRWLAHLCIHENEYEGGAEVEIICRRLVKMGYAQIKDGYYEAVNENE